MGRSRSRSPEAAVRARGHPNDAADMPRTVDSLLTKVPVDGVIAGENASSPISHGLRMLDNCPARLHFKSAETSLPERRVDTHLQTFFSGLSARQGKSGPIGELTAHLAAGESDSLFYRAVCEKYGVRNESSFLAQRLDALLAYANVCLEEDVRFTPAQLQNLNTLRTFLQIRDGEFASRRPVEVADILCRQLDEHLRDEILDDAEELYQTELQRIFGIGYDEYLAYTRPIIERVHAELEAKAPADENALHRLSVLLPIIRLVRAQRRSRGALHNK